MLLLPFNPSFCATTFSAPPAITSDCGTLPSGGKAKLSPRHATVLAVKSISTLLAGDDRFFFLRDLARELLAQTLHQRRDLDAQESVVVGIAQVGLRKAGGDHQRNAFGLQAGDGLFAARSGAEVESADDNIAGAGAERKLRIVVLHDHARHHLGRHVVAIGVVLAVDRVGVDVVLRHEDEAALARAREIRAGSPRARPSVRWSRTPGSCVRARGLRIDAGPAM